MGPGKEIGYAIRSNLPQPGPRTDAHLIRAQLTALNDLIVARGSSEPSLHLNQSSPPTVTGEAPTFEADVKIGVTAPHPSLPGILTVSDNGILLGETHGPLSEGQPVPPLRFAAGATEVVKADGTMLAPLKVGDATQSAHAATRGYVEANTPALDQTTPQAIINGSSKTMQPRQGCANFVLRPMLSSH